MHAVKSLVLHSQTAKWLFNPSELFFFSKGTPMKNRGRNDDRCVRRQKEKEKERKEEKDLYIRDALSAQDGRTDLHQGNHSYTSYGRSLYTRVYRFIDESLFLYSASPSDGTFLVGRKQKSRIVNQASAPYVGVFSAFVKRNRKNQWFFRSINLLRLAKIKKNEQQNIYAYNINITFFVKFLNIFLTKYDLIRFCTSGIIK